MAKILIVEDDENIADLIKDSLTLANYKTQNVYDGISAINAIHKEKYDLIILDIMLPGLDGFQILEKLKGCSTPMLILSAKTDSDSVVKGLKSGAQDYIRKPFDRIELLTRIEIILKRYHKEKTVYTFKNITLDTSKRLAYLNGEVVNLRPKEYELLELLMKNVNVALSRVDILDKVWGVTVDIETRTVDYHIQQLRKKLNLKNEITTINKIGYRLEL